MPPEDMQGAPPASGTMAGGAASPAAGGAPAQSMQGQASGPGGATMPVPNRGQEAAIYPALSNLMQFVAVLASKLPVGSDAYKDIHEGIIKITKHLQQDSSPGVLSTANRNMMMQSRQMMPQMMAQRAAQMGAMPGAGAGGAGGGGPPPPMAA